MEATRGLAERLKLQAGACAAMGSPFYGALLLRAASAYESGSAMHALLGRHEHRQRVGLLLAAAAHFRALSARAPQIAAHFPSTGGDGDADAAWRAIEADVQTNGRAYDEILSMTVQTNEVARAMPILGAMLGVAWMTGLPLRVFEIGSSAGLVLNFDRYHYAGVGWEWGDPRAGLTLQNRILAGNPPHLDVPLAVVERRGCDVHPLDATNDADAARLLSFVWPDQRERFERLRAAIALARAHPVAIERADGLEWIAREARPAAGAATVVMHTVTTEHLTQAQLHALEGVVRSCARTATRKAPFAWVRMEPPAFDLSYETSIVCWPGERHAVVARSDGHAQDLRWTTPAR